MGGCRCFFRKCKVNTYNCPGMHFFRFPTKDKPRCDQWVKYTQQKDFHYLPLRRQKNMTICGRHFRDECYMNYKKDRLSPSAVPSLHRLSNEKAIDFAQDIENGVLITLPEQKAKHLIAPPDFVCPLGFEYDIDLCELYATKESDIAESNIETLDDVGDGMEFVETIDIAADHSSNKRPHEETIFDEGVHKSCAKRPCNYYGGDDNSLTTNENGEKDETSDYQDLPVIINHQIKDTDNRLWFTSENFNLDQDSYQFVEIQSQSEQRIVEILDEDVEGELLSAAADMHQPDNLEAEYIEIQELHAQLTMEREKVKILENKLSNSRENIKGLQNANEGLQTKSTEAENMKLQVENITEEREKLQKEESEIREEYSCAKGNLLSLKSVLAKTKNDNLSLIKQHQKSQTLNINDIIQSQEYEQQLEQAQLQHSVIEQDLKDHIGTLEEKIQELQNTINDRDQTTEQLRLNYEELVKINEKLEADNKLLEISKNQVSTVSTSKSSAQQYTRASTGLTKAQLFNGIKRYISASMSSLLRMEMFGSAEREWKPDERQAAVDILRLGESVYKYLTDEWRFRLPALRDAHQWLNQSVTMDDEEDL